MVDLFNDTAKEYLKALQNNELPEEKNNGLDCEKH